MSVLKERLLEQQNGAPARGASGLRASNELQEIKTRVHRILINKLDLSKLENADPDAVQKDVKKVIERILDDENAPLSRSEEHTSELQSLTNLVCRLLLEKKKKNMDKPNRHQTNTTAK